MTPPSTSAISVTPVSIGVLTKAKLADYVQLSKPRIAVMAMVTVTIGFALGSSLTGWNSIQLLQSMLELRWLLPDPVLSTRRWRRKPIA